MATEIEDFDDLLVIEDLDIGDETELRQVVAEVEGLIGSPNGRGIRVSVLTIEQWKTVVKRMMPRSLRRGSELYVHLLRDPRDPQHLLVSPSAVNGINESSRQMYQELVYTVLRCMPTDLSRSLRKGLDDILAKACSKRIEIELYTRNYPSEADLVRSILETLSTEFGHDSLDWAIVLRRNPDRVFMALEKSQFVPFWQEKVGSPESARLTSKDLIATLTTDPLLFSEPLLQATEQTLAAYLVDGGKES